MCVFAPILLFTYKRLDTLHRTVKALQQNYHANESELFIFSDGPKTPEDVITITRVREYIKSIDGFKSTYIFESNSNKGLPNSIIDGVTQIINEYEKVIVLEDDLLTSLNFLSYMNQSLEFYKNNSKVFSISGYTIPISPPKNYKFNTYFLPRASSWGWATWKDRWDKVDWEAKSFRQLQRSKSQIKSFNEGGSDMYRMLKNQMNGKIESWAIRWCYHQFKINGYSLYPIISKIQNIGFDNMATHCNVFNRYNTLIDDENLNPILFPSEVVPDKYLLSKFQSFYSLRARAFGKIKTYLYKLGIYKNL